MSRKDEGLSDAASFSISALGDAFFALAGLEVVVSEALTSVGVVLGLSPGLIAG